MQDEPHNAPTGTITANGRTFDDAAAELTDELEPSRIYHDRTDIPPPPVKATGATRRRERWVKLPTTSDFGYQGWMIYMWTNFPSHYLQTFDDLDPQAKREILNKIFIKHNDWPDLDENIYPQPYDEIPDGALDFWAAIPQEIYNALIALMSVEQRQLSFLVQDKPRTSRRS